MKPSNSTKSILMFFLSVVFLILLTVFESVLVGLSINAERIVSFIFLVLPGMIGIYFGIKSRLQKESQAWIAYMGILLNTLFALFHLLVLAFAG